MARRILTAREQHEMLSPWRIAAQIRTHGEGCGHEAVVHGDHVDYLHGAHRHAVHDDHYDEH